MDRDGTTRPPTARGSAHDEPDENATGSDRGMPAPHPGSPARETVEREAAMRRAAAAIRDGGDGGPPPRHPDRGIANPGLARRAFAVLADNSRGYAIFLLNPDGIITFWGESARLMKWWTREQAEGGHLRMLYPDGGSEDGTAEQHLREAAATGEYTGEGHRVRSDGSTFWGGITLTALHHPDGTLAGFVKLTRDLTAQRVTEAAREAALEAADTANRQKSTFLATMSHEIRTPLNAILGYTDLMRLELTGPMSGKQRQYLDKIRSSGQHLLGLVEDVLSLSQAEAGRLSLAREKLRAGDVVAKALGMIEPMARERGVEIVNAVAGLAADHWSWGEEERVTQILLNLIQNAVKFSERGNRVIVSAGTADELPPDVERLGTEGPWVYFRVEDTGPGIAPEQITRIFEPFTQVDESATRRHSGSGLGLAISRHLARLMRGDVIARSEVGLGSTFLLWLCAAPAEEAASAPEPGEELGRRGAGTLHEIKYVMLAELERILSAYIERVRSDPAVSRARASSPAELEDHLASFLTDVAVTLASMELGSAGESDALQSGTAIERTIAEHHGRQRARLGWNEQEIRREFEILRQEVAGAVRRRVRRPRPREVEEMVQVLNEFIDRAEHVSLASYRLLMGE